jgi:hypothetical protein
MFLQREEYHKKQSPIVFFWGGGGLITRGFSLFVGVLEPNRREKRGMTVMTFNVDTTKKTKTSNPAGNLEQHLLQVTNHFSD